MAITLIPAEFKRGSGLITITLQDDLFHEYHPGVTWCAVSSAYQHLCNKGVIEGGLGRSGLNGFVLQFSVHSGTFCDEAVTHALKVLVALGVTKEIITEEIGPPRVHQRTLVRVSQNHPLYYRSLFNGWIEYGQLLGYKHGLKW